MTGPSDQLGSNTACQSEPVPFATALLEGGVGYLGPGSIHFACHLVESQGISDSQSRDRPLAGDL